MGHGVRHDNVLIDILGTHCEIHGEYRRTQHLSILSTIPTASSAIATT
jgi:hypothetical protein